MRKVIGVGAVLLLAGAVMAPANAAPVASVAPVAVVQTVAVEADPVAVLDFESPAVATVAAPEPDPVVVAPVPVEATPVAPVEPVTEPEPVAVPVAVDTVGGTVTETETTPTVEPEVTEPTPTPEPTAPEPEPEPTPTPEPTTPEVVLVQEGDAYAYNEWDPAFYEYNIDPATGQPFAGEYVGTFYAKSIEYFAGRTDVVVKEQAGVTFHPDMDPMGTNVLYVFHLWTAVAPAE